ncbi:MAG TPA: hypothetical protein DCZ94_08500 [Lentisphaeria bacterium]|nr:MAG: hypothetical protein A2X48_09185 [Lentisphaerae bacterium GWF2_49_21]HBC86978.1 hypothetical protein [Lentisphaeria bacterium]
MIIMHPFPDIYIAAIITTMLAWLVIGGLLFHRAPKEDRFLLGILIIVMLPMNALAFHAVRMPLDSLISEMLSQNRGILGFIRVLYAPLTEEPAKLWPLMIPWIFLKINRKNLVMAAIAIGLGFGIGEAWNVAYLLSKNPEIAKYPWYMLGGYVGERAMVCIMHAAFTVTALYFIVLRKSIVKGLLFCMTLHFIGNFPIYLAGNNLFGLGKVAWMIILNIWVLAYFLAMGGILAYLEYGDKWLQKIFKGVMKCPECGIIYQRPVFKFNLFHKCYEKCPACRRWHLVSAFDYEENKNVITEHPPLLDSYGGTGTDNTKTKKKHIRLNFPVVVFAIVIVLFLIFVLKFSNKDERLYWKLKSPDKFLELFSCYVYHLNLGQDEQAWKELESMGSKAMPILIRLMQNDREKVIRTYAIWKIEILLNNKEDNSALEPLCKALLNDESEDVRSAAADALEIWDKKASLNSLIEAYKQERNSFVRKHVVDALGAIGDKSALDTLINALQKDKSEDVRASAAIGLSSFKYQNSGSHLINALHNDESVLVRLYAAQALMFLKDQAAVPSLIEALEKDKDSDVLYEICSALGKLGDKSAIGPLKKAMQNDKSKLVQVIAAAALVELGDFSGEEFLRSEYLKHKIDNKDDSVIDLRETIKETLKKIDKLRKDKLSGTENIK